MGALSVASGRTPPPFVSHRIHVYSWRLLCCTCGVVGALCECCPTSWMCGVTVWLMCQVCWLPQEQGCLRGGNSWYRCSAACHRRHRVPHSQVGMRSLLALLSIVLVCCCAILLSCVFCRRSLYYVRCTLCRPVLWPRRPWRTAAGCCDGISILPVGLLKLGVSMLQVSAPSRLPACQCGLTFVGHPAPQQGAVSAVSGHGCMRRAAVFAQCSSSSVQIIASGSSAYDVPWPASFQRLLDVCKVFLVDVIR
jgi:hypothetical protein